MPPTRTPVGNHAQRIFDTIVASEHPFRCDFTFEDCEATAVRQSLLNKLTDSKMNGTIVTSVVNDVLYVGTPSKGRYVHRLEKMVKRLMLHVDSETVYEEAESLLAEKHGGFSGI